MIIPHVGNKQGEIEKNKDMVENVSMLNIPLFTVVSISTQFREICGKM